MKNGTSSLPPTLLSRLFNLFYYRSYVYTVSPRHDIFRSSILWWVNKESTTPSRIKKKKKKKDEERKKTSPPPNISFHNQFPEFVWDKRNRGLRWYRDTISHGEYGSCPDKWTMENLPRYVLSDNKTFKLSFVSTGEFSFPVAEAYVTSARSKCQDHESPSNSDGSQPRERNRYNLLI